MVEDDRKIATILKRGLDSEGFSVDVSFDGTDGLWKASEYHYDALIVDLMLPGHDDFGISRKLRGQGDWTPILVLTPKDGEFGEMEALNSGADDYLTKPFSLACWLRSSAPLPRRTSGGVPAAVQVGDLRLDSLRHRCWPGGTEIRSRRGSPPCSNIAFVGPGSSPRRPRSRRCLGVRLRRRSERR